MKYLKVLTSVLALLKSCTTQQVKPEFFSEISGEETFALDSGRVAQRTHPRVEFKNMDIYDFAKAMDDTEVDHMT